MTILICGYLWRRDKATWIVSTIALTPGFSIQAVLEVNSSFQQSRGYLEVTVNSNKVLEKTKPVGQPWSDKKIDRLPGTGPFNMVQVIRNAVEMQVKHGPTPFESTREPCYPRANRDHPYLGFHNMSWVRMPNDPRASWPALPQSSSLVFKVIEGPSLPLARPHEEVAAICGLEKISCVSEFHVSILMKKLVKPICLSEKIWNANLLKMGTKMYQAESWMTHNYICFKTIYPKIRMVWPENNLRPFLHAKTCQDTKVLLQLSCHSRVHEHTARASQLSSWQLGIFSGDSLYILYMFPSFFWKQKGRG